MAVQDSNNAAGARNQFRSMVMLSSGAKIGSAPANPIPYLFDYPVDSPGNALRDLTEMPAGFVNKNRLRDLRGTLRQPFDFHSSLLDLSHQRIGEFFLSAQAEEYPALSGCSRWNSSQPGNHVDPEQLAEPQSRGSSQSASA